MADVTTLGLKVDSSGVVRGVTEAKAALGQLDTAGQRTSAQVENVGRNMTLSAASANRLAASLGPVASAAANVNPQLARVAQTLGLLVGGGPIMVGVLLGVTALGAAIREYTRIADEMNDRIDKQVESLRELQRELDFGAKAGFLQRQANVRAEIQLLSDLIQARAALARDAERGRGPGGLVRGGLPTTGPDPKIVAWTQQIGQLAQGLSTIEQAMARVDAQQNRVSGGQEKAASGASSAAQAFDKQATAVAGLNNELAVLLIQLDAVKRGMPTTADVLSGTVFGTYGGRRPMSPESGMGGIRLPDPVQMRTRTVPNAPGSLWDRASGFVGSHANQFALAGGLILGSGLAGNGAVASGLGGALQFGAMGAQIAGPVGAIVGAVGGLVKGLWDHGKRAKEAAAQLKEAQRAFDLSIQARMAAAGGDTQRAEDLRRQAQNERELSEARKAGMSRASMEALRQVQALEAQAAATERARAAEEKLREEREAALRTTEDLLSRALRATGQEGLADRASLLFGQRRERAEAVASGAGEGDLSFRDRVHSYELMALDLSRRSQDQIAAIERNADAQLAILAEQEQTAQAQLRVQEEQLRAQERTVEALRRVVESLSEYRTSLDMGPTSSLSPWSQLGAARNQYEMLYSLAAGGDVSAAASIPGAGRSRLEAARGYYASGPGYAEEEARVRATVDALRGKFAGQLTIEERTLNELQAHTAKLNEQISKLQEQQQTLRDETAKQIAAVNAAAEAERLRWQTEFEKWIEQNSTLWSMLQEVKGLKLSDVDPFNGRDLFEEERRRREEQAARDAEWAEAMQKLQESMIGIGDEIRLGLQRMGLS